MTHRRCCCASGLDGLFVSPCDPEAEDVCMDASFIAAQGFASGDFVGLRTGSVVGCAEITSRQCSATVTGELFDNGLDDCSDCSAATCETECLPCLPAGGTRLLTFTASGTWAYTRDSIGSCASLNLSDNWAISHAETLDVGPFNCSLGSSTRLLSSTVTEIASGFCGDPTVKAWLRTCLWNRAGIVRRCETGDEYWRAVNFFLSFGVTISDTAPAACPSAETGQQARIVPFMRQPDEPAGTTCGFGAYTLDAANLFNDNSGSDTLNLTMDTVTTVVTPS